MNTIAESISTFPVSPSAQSVTIPQELLGAIQGLREEVSRLQATVASQDEKIAAWESRADQQEDNGLIQLRLIKDLRDEVHKEPPAPATTKKSTGHIDDLHRLMVEDRSKQVSIAKAARLLGISKERARQLKPLILQDGRFEMGWSTIKGKKAVVIRIRQFLK